MYIDKDMPHKIKVFNIYKGEQTGNIRVLPTKTNSIVS